MKKISKTVRILTITILAIEGVYLLGYCKVKESRPITLKEYKTYVVSPERVQTVTEKDLIIDGKPLQILMERRFFSLLWMIVGAMLGGTGAWILLWLIQKSGEMKTREVPIPRETALSQISPPQTIVDRIPSSKTSVQIVFVVLVMMFAVVDFVHITRSNPMTTEGHGYNHHEFAKLWAGAAETANICSWNRVGFNFRHFIKWWVVPPRMNGFGVTQMLTSDGNCLETNLAGHLGGSTLLVLIALWLSGSVPMVVVAGTAINIFHEYVAEGRYCDPSFVDLWLDQAGILLAVTVCRFVSWKAPRLRRRINGNDKE